MHIPNAMLNGGICPVTAVLSAVGVIGAAIRAMMSKEKPPAAKFAAVTAFIFAGQMMNFPVQNGTSGHLLGGVLAVSLLGLPFGVISMALVVTIQCLVFSDGGFTVLGANVVNMALIGAGLGGLVKIYLTKGFPGDTARYRSAVGLAAWLSVMMAALACGLELAVSGTIALSKVLPSMLGVHALIGIGEAVVTVVAVTVFSSRGIEENKRLSVGVPLTASLIIASLLSPFASGFPDGLEWVAEKFNFLHGSAPTFVTPFADYSVSWFANEAVSTALAGILGVTITFAAAFFAAWLLSAGRPLGSTR